jgi:GT2 family glycosyltransferase
VSLDLDISVIVVTHGGGELALQALRTSRERAGDIRAEWLVVDSGSPDDTPDRIAAAMPDIPVTRLPNVGFAAANNHAIRRARGRYVLVLNPDMELRTGTLEELVRAMDARPEVGVSSVIQIWPAGGVQETIRRFPSPARQLGEALALTRFGPFRDLTEEERDPAAYEREQSVDWLVGGFLLLRRAAIDAVGGLDERFFMYSEETDWCYRLRAAGWDIRHLPLMTVAHHTGRMARPDLFAQNSHSKLLFAAKHFSPARSAAFRAALAIRHAVRLAAVAPAAVVRPRLRRRAAAEGRALAVVIGAQRAPFSPIH